MTTHLENFPLPPLAEEILAARKSAGLTQSEAAALIYKVRRSWTQYEAGLRELDPALWELWKIKATMQKRA